MYFQLMIFIYYCRSYLTPVRDEESESQRKARSRQARQSRRSTQVCLMCVIYKSSELCFRFSHFCENIDLSKLVRMNLKI